MADDKHSPAASGKGHATPKRKDREAERKRPMVLDRKADLTKRKNDRRAQAMREHEAMLSGDERNMPAQHAGAPRRFARDYVDSRTTVGEFLLPASLIALVAMMFGKQFPTIAAAASLGVLLMIVAWVFESIILLGRMRKKAIAKFGADRLPRLYRMYGLTRMLQFRPLRLPKPQVKRGAFPV